MESDFRRSPDNKWLWLSRFDEHFVTDDLGAQLCGTSRATFARYASNPDLNLQRIDRGQNIRPRYLTKMSEVEDFARRRLLDRYVNRRAPRTALSGDELSVSAMFDEQHSELVMLREQNLQLRGDLADLQVTVDSLIKAQSSTASALSSLRRISARQRANQADVAK